MTTPMMTFEQYSVWLLPFPFTDKATTKHRPAIVVSAEKTFNTPVGHSVVAMITSSRNSPWDLDTPVKDLASAGLNIPSMIRMKLFTIDHRLVIRQLGKLSADDAKKLEANLKLLLLKENSE
jgi:mRNA interferase MazF